MLYILSIETDIYRDYIKRNSLLNKVMKLIGFSGLWLVVLLKDHKSFI